MINDQINEAALINLKKLRDPFPDNQISKLPKPTKQQTDEVKQDYKKGIRCPACTGWHHPNVVHLDYVGHAALTDRLLDVDPIWYWEPVSFNDKGLPQFDDSGGLWIKLTVCGMTRLGYGVADGKTGGDAIKECIGDALRNAAMRFGAALDLWHKGDLHAHIESEVEEIPAHYKAAINSYLYALSVEDDLAILEIFTQFDNDDNEKISAILQKDEEFTCIETGTTYKGSKVRSEIKKSLTRSAEAQGKTVAQMIADERNK